MHKIQILTHCDWALGDSKNVCLDEQQTGWSSSGKNGNHCCAFKKLNELLLSELLNLFSLLGHHLTGWCSNNQILLRPQSSSFFVT